MPLPSAVPQPEDLRRDAERLAETDARAVAADQRRARPTNRQRRCLARRLPMPWDHVARGAGDRQDQHPRAVPGGTFARQAQLPKTHGKPSY